jgi:phosphoribosyl 1,2-cyclic phosphodiesterase
MLERYVDGLTFADAGTYGGHTSCVELETGGSEYVICDLGTGLRPFGNAALARHGPASPQTYHIFVSHVHWDHIMGLPFFAPAYVAGNRISIYGSHAWLESALRRQQDAPSFPVDFSFLQADIQFRYLEPDKRTPSRPDGSRRCCSGMPAIRMATASRRTAARSFTRRIPSTSSTTDGDRKLRGVLPRRGRRHLRRDVFAGRRVSVRADWGHSSNVVGVELCQLAGAKHLCLFHHEPSHSDQAIDAVLADTRRLEEITRTGQPLRISAAYDGMEIEL